MRWPNREKRRSNYCQLDYELSIAIYLVGAGHLFTVHHRNALAIQNKRRSNYCQLDYELSIAIYLVGAGHLFTVYHRNALAIQRKTAF